MKSISNNSSLWFVICSNNHVLLNKNNKPLSENDIPALIDHFTKQFSLGECNEIEYFCAEVTDDLTIDAQLNFIPLREALSLLNSDQFGWLIKAHSVLNWDKDHQFCGRCRELTIRESEAFERTCPSCKLSFFPRISPSIIVLIYKEDKLVMARSPHFSPGVYALIAGFVEAGENLEEAVHREVKEEVGLQIKNLSYFGSQPWPFPDSLMIAFTAEYASGDIVIDNKEIEDAGWYRYDNLPGRPTPSSIASQLLDSFINTCKKK